MGLFDRFTGKEMEGNIEEYTETYGEILLGMHQKLKKLEKQIENLQNQSPALTNSTPFDSTIHNRIKVLNQELNSLKTLVDKRSDDFSTFSQHTKEILQKHHHSSRNQSNQIQSLQQELQEYETKLNQELNVLNKQLTKTDSKVTLLQQEYKEVTDSLTTELHKTQIELKERIEASRLRIRKLEKNLIEEQMERQATEEGFHNQLQDQKQKRIELEQLVHQLQQENESQHLHFQKNFKRLSWLAGSGIGLLFIWELIQLF